MLNLPLTDDVLKVFDKIGLSVDREKGGEKEWKVVKQKRKVGREGKG